MKALTDLTGRKTPAILLYLLALIPAALLFSFILAYSTNLPMNDDWNIAPLIVKLHTGGFTFNDFWSQHNEHRIVLPRLFFLGLALLGSWDVTREMIVSFIIAVLTLIPVWGLLKLTLPDRRLLPVATLLASLLLYSTVQYQNWLWGFQLAWFLVNFFAFAATWALYRRPNSGRSLALAAGITILATFTMASGIPIWPALFAGLLLQWKLWRKRYLAAWLVIWLVMMAVYFYNYHPVEGHTDNLYFLTHPLEFGWYVLAYLGNPLAFWSNGVAWPVALSLVSLALLAAMLAWLWRRYARQKGSPWSGVIPWLELILFSAFNAGITGIGRVGFGLDQALASRYTTHAALYWIGWVVIGLIFARQFLTEAPPRFRPVFLPVSAVVAVLFTGLYGLSYVKGQAEMESWDAYRPELIPFILNYSSSSTDALRQIHGNVPFLKTWAWSLDQWKEGPFADSVRARYQARDRQKQELISSDRNRALVIPAASLSLTEGDRQSVEYQGAAIRFQHYGPANSSIYLDLAKAPEYQGLSGSELSLDLRLEQAWYVRIYWDTGNGLNEMEKSLLYPVEGTGESRHFVTRLPPGTRAFRVDVNYNNGRVLWDSLQASLYRGKVD